MEDFTADDRRVAILYKPHRDFTFVGLSYLIDGIDRDGLLENAVATVFLVL